MLFNRLWWGRLSSSSSVLFRVPVTKKKKKKNERRRRRRRITRESTFISATEASQEKLQGGICVCPKVKVFHVLLFRILDPWPLTACILWKVSRERGCMKESVLSIRFTFFKRTETRPRRAWSGSHARGRRDRSAKYEDWVRDNDLSCPGYPCQSLSGYFQNGGRTLVGGVKIYLSNFPYQR